MKNMYTLPLAPPNPFPGQNVVHRHTSDLSKFKLSMFICSLYLTRHRGWGSHTATLSN